MAVEQRMCGDTCWKLRDARRLAISLKEAAWLK